MKIKTIASNLTELQVNGMTFAFSYSTPVAGWDEYGAFKTDTKFSPTTSKHIKKYLGAAFDNARVVPQKMIEEMQHDT
jgi:hypothetical protein